MVAYDNYAGCEPGIFNKEETTAELYKCGIKFCVK